MTEQYTETPPGKQGSSTGPCDLADIASLSREELIDRLVNFRGSFRLDFTADFLARKPTAQLRHILIAAHKHAAGLTR